MKMELKNATTREILSRAKILVPPFASRSLSMGSSLHQIVCRLSIDTYTFVTL